MSVGAVAQAVADLRSGRRSIPLGVAGGDRVFGGWEDSVTVIGPPRSGKSSAIFIPAVALHPGPVVVTSTRPDVRDNTAQVRAALAARVGGTCVELAVDEVVHAHPLVRRLSWDLTDGCQSWNVARDRAFSLVSAAIPDRDSQFWRDTTQSLVASCLWVAAQNGLSDRDVLAKIETGDLEDVTAYLEWAAKSSQDGEQASRSFDRVMREGALADETRSTVFGFASNQALGALSYSFPFAEDEPGGLDQLLADMSTIYITVRSERAKALAPWIASLVEALTSTWRSGARANSEGPLLLALDEVANVAPAQSIPSIITTGGGDRIQSLLGLQDPDQANHWEGNESVVLTGSTHTVLFPGLAHHRFLEGLSRLLPKTIRNDQFVEVDPATPEGPRYASPQRLIVERGQLERQLDGLHARGRNRLSGAVASREATRIWADRIREGVETRPLPGKSGSDAVLHELMTYTSVRLGVERREAMEVPDMFAGVGPRSALVRSGQSAEFRDFPRYYEDELFSLEA